MPLEGASEDSEQAIVAEMIGIMQREQMSLMREKREEALSSVYEEAQENPHTLEMLNALQLMRDQLLELIPDVPREAIASSILASTVLLSSPQMRSQVPQLSSESLLLVLSSLIDRSCS